MTREMSTTTWRWGVSLVLMTAALGSARAAPPAGYASEVKRLEQARLNAYDAPAKAFAIGEAILRAHLGALGPAGIAEDKALDAADATIRDLVRDCATMNADSAEIDRLSNGADEDDPAVGARILALLKRSTTIDPACVARVARRVPIVVEASLQPGDTRRLDLLEVLGASIAEQGGFDAAAPIVERVLATRIARLRPGEADADFALTEHFSRSREPVAFEAILRRKGRIVETQADLIAAARASAAVEPQRASAPQAEAGARLAPPTTRRRAPRGTRRSTAITDESRRMTAAIAPRRSSIVTGPKRAPPSVDAVRSALAEGEALVELIAYRPLDPALLFLDSPADAPLSDGYGPPRYAAYVLARSGEIVGIDRGDAAVIDAAAAKFRAALADEKIAPAAAARELDKLTMARIRSLVGDVRRLLLSPDGALALVPFAALVDERGRYLVEDWSFRYLSSGRDVAHRTRAPRVARSAGHRR